MISVPPLFDLSNQVGKDFTMLCLLWSKVDTYLSSENGNNTFTESFSILVQRPKAKGCYTVLLGLFHVREGTLFVPGSSAIQISSVANNTEPCNNFLLAG